MKVEVRPIYQGGKPIQLATRLKGPPVRGKLKVFENRLHAFGRNVRCASLSSATDGTDTALLPELLDVEILMLDGEAMRLRGMEQVDGCLLGQTWDVKVL